MALLKRFVFRPLRSLWSMSLGRRLRDDQQHSNGPSLYNQVQSCGYQDVHVLWSLLQQSSHLKQQQ